MDHYLFLSSLNSKDRHPENDSTDFTIEFPAQYRLNGEWECALKEIETNIDSQIMYVCCDLCVQSYVRDTMYPVLRIVKSSKRGKKFTFQDPFYVKVKSDKVNRLRMFIRGSELQPLAKDTTELRCTIHLRKSKWM